MSRGPWCKSEQERKERQRASFERFVAKNGARYREMARERSKRRYELRKELLQKISQLDTAQLKAIVDVYCPTVESEGDG